MRHFILLLSPPYSPNFFGMNGLLAPGLSDMSASFLATPPPPLYSPLSTPFQKIAKMPVSRFRKIGRSFKLFSSHLTTLSSSISAADVCFFVAIFQTSVSCRFSLAKSQVVSSNIAWSLCERPSRYSRRNIHLCRFQM